GLVPSQETGPTRSRAARVRRLDLGDARAIGLPPEVELEARVEHAREPRQLALEVARVLLDRGRRVRGRVHRRLTTRPAWSPPSTEASRCARSRETARARCRASRARRATASRRRAPRAVPCAGESWRGSRRSTCRAARARAARLRRAARRTRRPPRR